MRLCGSLVLIIVAAATAAASIIDVPADYPTIQLALDATSDGDTVLVQPGLYLENVDFHGRNAIVGSLFLTTEDTSYITSTVIDGGSSGSVITFQSGEDSTCALTGFTIQHGASLFGGGILCRNSSPTIDHNIVTENIAESGGGIFCDPHSSPLLSNLTVSQNRAQGDSPLGNGGGICSEGSQPTITHCTISGNWANRTGGGIGCSWSSAVIENCTITENTARIFGGGICLIDSDPVIGVCNVSGNLSGDDGGGIFCMRSDPTIDSCAISDNTAIEWGGGICGGWDSRPLVRNCTISGNTGGDGGGLYCYDSYLVVSNCFFADNLASGGGGVYSHNDGGAIFMGYGAASSLTLSRCILSRNSAGRHAGAISVGSTSTLTASNCTITENTAAQQGGAIWCYNSTLGIQNTIVEGNVGEAGIHFSGTSTASVSFGDFFNNAGGDFSGNIPTGLGAIVAVNANGDSCDVFRNIILDPQFVSASAGDYHLQASSPCIDAGNPMSIPDPDSTISDMGAYFYDQQTWMGPPENPDPPLRGLRPAGFSLFPNYPNPFNPTTTLEYSLSNSAMVTLFVYDITGRKVRALVQGWQAVGIHRLTFDGSDLASGAYVAILQAGNACLTTCMILLK